MAYVDFITDEHFLDCVEFLYNSYKTANDNIDTDKLYANKIDVVKLSFDKGFGNLSEAELIKREVTRQVDKSISNAIGTFHEKILGGITGYERGISNYDIKASDNTLFADIKNKHNTMNSGGQESLFQRLVRFATTYPEARCYCVQILCKSSFNELWSATLNGTLYSHDRVYKISGDRFYELLTGDSEALCKLYKALPDVINDYLDSLGTNISLESQSTAFVEIQQEAARENRSLLNQIASDNYGNYYDGFDGLQ